MGYDLASTFYNRAETVLTKANAATLDIAWQKDLGGPVYSAPLQIGDKIYVAAPSTVRAYVAATGEELWSTMASSTSSLSYVDGTLYLNDRSANIVAINAADGTKLWTKPINTESQADGSSSVLPVGDMLVVGGSSGAVELIGGTFRGFMSGLDRATGAIKWTTYTVPDGAKGASIWSSPSADLAAGVVYGATGNNYGAPATDTSDAFIAFDLQTGTIKWKNQRVKDDTFGGGIGLRNGPDADFGANPVLYETMIGGVMTKVIGAGNKGGVAHAVRADTGEELWTRTLCPGSTDGSRGVFVNSTWSGKYLIMGVQRDDHGDPLRARRRDRRDRLDAHDRRARLGPHLGGERRRLLADGSGPGGVRCRHRRLRSSPSSRRAAPSPARSRSRTGAWRSARA